jgi:hypothetical protein
VTFAPRKAKKTNNEEREERGRWPSNPFFAFGSKEKKIKMIIISNIYLNWVINEKKGDLGGIWRVAEGVEDVEVVGLDGLEGL